MLELMQRFMDYSFTLAEGDKGPGGFGFVIVMIIIVVGLSLIIYGTIDRIIDVIERISNNSVDKARAKASIQKGAKYDDLSNQIESLKDEFWRAKDAN